MGELLTTISHEAGHAVAAFLLEATENPGPVSVRPGEGYHGIAFTGHVRGFGRRVPSRGRLWVQLPPGTQRVIQITAMVELAGDAAEVEWADLLMPSRGAVPAEDAQVSTTGSDAPPEPELPERELAMLRRAAVATEGLSDWNLYWNLMMDAHDEDTDSALGHLDFLAAEVRKLLRTGRAHRMGAKLARELLIRRTLPAELWLRLLQAVPE